MAEPTKIITDDKGNILVELYGKINTEAMARSMAGAKQLDITDKSSNWTNKIGK